MKQFDIFLADLNPGRGTESGKIRPVLIIQTNLLIKVGHPSTLVCPLTTNIKEDSYPLRVHIKNTETEILLDSDILIDQIRAIENKRFVRYLATIPDDIKLRVKESLSYILDLEE
jgi:mRNA interferase MazF